MDKKKLYESAQQLRKLGRNEDTILAHINPREAAVLKSLGGSGNINPNTGLPEFDDFGWGDFSWYTPYVAPSFDFSTPSYSVPTYSAPVIDYSSTWQGTPGSNAGAFGGITNTPEYQAMGTTDPITSYVNTPVNMGDPYNLISSGPAYETSQSNLNAAIDYANQIGGLGGYTPTPTPDTTPVSTSAPDVTIDTGESSAPSSAEPISGGLNTSVTPEPAPEPISGGLPAEDTSTALTGDVAVPEDIAQGPLPTWSYSGDNEGSQKIVDEVVKDVFKQPETVSEKGKATNGMTLKELTKLSQAGFGSNDISDTQTVDQAIAALKLSQMKPSQALGLISGVVTGNPYAIASSIASIAGENKVAQMIGIASNMVSGNTAGVLAGLAGLSGQKDIANVIGMANALKNGNTGAFAQIAAGMTGNQDLATAIGAINAVASGNPFAITSAFLNAQPTLTRLASGDLFNTIGQETIASNDPTGDISAAYQYAGSNPNFNFDTFASNIASNYGIDPTSIPGVGGVPVMDVGTTASAAAAPEASFSTAFASPFAGRALGDPFDWSKYFPKSKAPMIVNAPEDRAAQPKEEETQTERQVKNLEQIFGSLDPAMQNLLIERGFGAGPTSPFGGLHAASGGEVSILDSMNAVTKALTPDFGGASVRAGLPGGTRKSPLQLAQLQQMRSSIAPQGGMAKGGLPSKYHEAMPDGHNPEFVTGLTGYYAGGRGTGQSDDIPAMLHDGDYVIDAEAVSALGDGSSKAGKDALTGFLHQVPHRDGAEGKPVPAKIADGEFVLPASFVTALGGGDNKHGAKMLDEMRERLREHKRSAPTSKIPPKALSPLDYLKKAK